MEIKANKHKIGERILKRDDCDPRGPLRRALKLDATVADSRECWGNLDVSALLHVYYSNQLLL